MFLQPDHHVVPTLDCDYPDWHKGRTAFSLWYIPIEDRALLDYLNALRAHFKDVLYQPNTRQFHITVFICGFPTCHAVQHNDDFSHISLLQQKQFLKQQQFEAIKLQTGSIQSFESALFVEIVNPHPVLAILRQGLGQFTDEIAALKYCAHITLGLYRTKLLGAEVYERIEGLSQRCFDFKVDKICYGTYQAQQLQGELTAQYSVQLGGS